MADVGYEGSGTHHTHDSLPEDIETVVNVKPICLRIPFIDTVVVQVNGLADDILKSKLSVQVYYTKNRRDLPHSEADGKPQC